MRCIKPVNMKRFLFLAFIGISPQSSEISEFQIAATFWHSTQSQFHHQKWVVVAWRFSLCCLMTPGLRKDIRCHVSPHVFLNLKSPDQTLGHIIKLAVSLVIAYGHFNHPQGFVWVCMG